VKKTFMISTVCVPVLMAVALHHQMEHVTKLTHEPVRVLVMVQ